MFPMKESGKREDRTILILPPAEKWPQLMGEGALFPPVPPHPIPFLSYTVDKLPGSP